MPCDPKLPLPPTEEKRLQLIQELNILQHYQNDENFQRITALAAEYFKVRNAKQNFNNRNLTSIDFRRFPWL